MQRAKKAYPKLRWLGTSAWLGAVMDVAALILWLILVHSQEGDNGITIAFSGSFIAFLAGLSIAAAITAARGRPSRILLLTAGAVNIGIGVLGILSIGVLFIVAGVLLLSAEISNTLPRALPPPSL
jgi:hypothetical protein